jgi:hypothetical protein
MRDQLRVPENVEARPEGTVFGSRRRLGAAIIPYHPLRVFSQIAKDVQANLTARSQCA